MKRFLFTALAASLVPFSSKAHVGYVLSQEQVVEKGGTNFSFLLSPLAQLENVVLLILSLLVITILYRVFHRVFLVKKEWKHIEKTAKSYDKLIPWMLRLSLGIAFVGAGVNGVLISPALPGFAYISFVQILIGFLFLSGFFLVAAVIAAIFLYVLALGNDFYILGNIELLAASIALWMLAVTRPGVDDLIGIPFYSPFKKLKAYVPLVLRLGIGGAMVFLAIYEKFLNPELAAAVVLEYNLTSAIPVSVELWVLGAGVIELLVGLALLLGFHTRFAAGVAFLVLSLSFFYFREDVASHITLFGVLSVLFTTGGGRLSVTKNNRT